MDHAICETPAVILAGGLARRMGGGDKALAPLAGAPMLAHVIARLRGQAGALALNANGDPAQFSAFGLPVLADTVPGRPGPLAGILVAMDWAAGLEAEGVVSVAADTPFFPDDLVARLVATAREAGAPIALAATRDEVGALRRHPTFGYWSVTLRDDLRANLAAGVRRMQQWADGHGAISVNFEATPHDPFFNVNTPEDLALASQMLHDLAR